MNQKIKNPQVAQVFQEYPPQFRKKLLEIRKIIIESAESIDQVDELLETLKWGQPSYLPKKKNIGTTIRIHCLKSKPDQFGIFFNCNTNLISRIKRKFGATLQYEGKRALMFYKNDRLPIPEIKECIIMALTYHLHKKSKRR